MATDHEQHDQRTMPLAAATLVALLLVLAVVGGVLWFTRDGDAASTPSGAPVSAESPTAGPTASSAPTAAPQASDSSEIVPGWSSTEVAGTVLPVSTEAGPHDLSEGLARDFEHSEMGAVMAAAHLVARVSGYATPDVFRPTIAKQVVDGGNAERLLSVAMATHEEVSAEQGRDDPRGTGTLRGYRVTSYGQNAATVELWTEARGPDGVVRIGTPIDLVWADAGWRLVPPPDGRWSEAVRELVDTGEYTEFPPEVR